MRQTTSLDRFMQPLLTGRRQACREILEEQLGAGKPANKLYQELIWPAMEKVEKLFRADNINTATEHMATRINRALADQLQKYLPQEENNGKRIVITCADGEPEELGAQMCTDLFESSGWETFFVGGGVPNDEIMTLIGQINPDILLIFGTQPQGVPQVRKLIDTIREIGVNPTMNVMVSGGVFNRAEGLWEEINADLFGATASEALDLAENAKPRKPEIRIPGAPKKRRRRRRATYLQPAEK